MAKRVLVTGMNRSQCTPDYWQRQEIGVVLAQHGLIQCLMDMGWEVDQREVRLGEDLSSYDEVIFFVHNITGYAHALFSGMYALSARPDCILAFDDWQVTPMLQAIDGMIGHMESGDMTYSTGNHRIYKDMNLGIMMTKYSLDELKSYEAHYLEGLRVVARRQNRLLLTLFDGGDWRLIRSGWREDRIFPFNPNAYHYRRTPENSYGCLNPLMAATMGPVSPEDKEARWNFASLLHNKTGTWLKKQALSWPVDSYGQRKGENKTARLTEDEMCHQYAKSWGCLIPPYDHAGSGWWRTRVLQVADAGSVLLAHPAEAKVYGQAYEGLTSDKIEGMTVHELEALAKSQRDCLLDTHPLDKSVMRNRINAALEADKT